MYVEMLKSEIKKAEAFANKKLGRNDCKVTGYSSKHEADTVCGRWVRFTCEICFNYEERAPIDVDILGFLDDRRRSFATLHI